MKRAVTWNRLRLRAFSGVLPVTLLVSACGVSTQQELELGAQYSNEINRQIPIVSDNTVHRAINVLGDEIARHGKRGIDYTFFVVNAPEVNAFAVPGGYVYVNRGLVDRTANWSELAGVLAHEIGHVEERHGVEQMERLQGANLGLNVVYVLLGRQPGAVESAAVNAGGTAIFSKYSRDAENEADRVAVPMLLATRVHPRGLITMFETLMREQRSSPSSVAQWFSTHPTTEERIEQTRRAIAQIPAAQLNGLTTTSTTYNSLKARLRQLPAAPRSSSSR